MRRKLTIYVACLFACACANAPAAERVVLRGCVNGGGASGLFLGVPGKTQSYQLTGNIKALTKYIAREVSLEGRINESTQPWPSFSVLGVKRVFEIPQPAVSASFADSSLRRHENNRKYGINYTHPATWTRFAESRKVRPFFASDEGAVDLGSYEMPRDLYPNSNFVGGAFGVFVNPRITNAQSCAQFGDADARLRSSRRVGDIEYSAFSDGGGAMGTYYSGTVFHTFQNGLCYQVSFEFAEWNIGNSDTGCTVPSLKEPDKLKVVDPLIGAISFSQPADQVTPNESIAPITPRVIAFTSSSGTADTATNLGLITLSWKTENTDYVELSYTCFPTPNGAGVSISEDNVQRGCENNPIHLYSETTRNHSPNSSAAVLFGNFLQARPISITVMLTPFSRGTSYPAAAKYVTVGVAEFNPFPGGLPAPNGNMTLTYAPEGGASGSYRQGSAVTIRWEDKSSFPDSCVNLWLAQDDGQGRMAYRMHIGDACLKPPRAGSFRWTIPNTFSGSGYRIFAITPGSTASGSGPAFAIESGTPR